jgi:hypothetical protein
LAAGIEDGRVVRRDWAFGTGLEARRTDVTQPRHRAGSVVADDRLSTRRR